MSAPSGAFLLAACRYLADQLVAAWTREGRLAEAGPDPLNHARRLVAQKCLYGVDKNPFAVSLAKLSLLLMTLAKDLPFTFVDHALRHGDSLMGLTFEQIRGFHWKPSQQRDLCSKELDAALEEAIQLRQQIQELADDPSPEAQKQSSAALSLDQQKKGAGKDGAAAKPRRGRKPKGGGGAEEGEDRGSSSSGNGPRTSADSPSRAPLSALFSPC